MIHTTTSDQWVPPLRFAAQYEVRREKQNSSIMAATRPK